MGADEIVDELLSHGADPNQQTKVSCRPYVSVHQPTVTHTPILCDPCFYLYEFNNYVLYSRLKQITIDRPVFLAL